jgi:P27 family predicted phage terminase small subunit
MMAEDMELRGRRQEGAGPHRPTWLSNKARAQWDAFAAVVGTSGVSPEADAVLLGLLAEAIVEYDKVNDLARRRPPIIKRPGGSMRHAAYEARERLATQITALLRELGLTARNTTAAQRGMGNAEMAAGADGGNDSGHR